MDGVHGHRKTGASVSQVEHRLSRHLLLVWPHRRVTGPAPGETRGPVLGPCFARRTFAANDMRRTFCAPYWLVALLAAYEIGVARQTHDIIDLGEKPDGLREAD